MDLDKLFSRAFEGFGEPKLEGFPVLPGNPDDAGKSQSIDNKDVSRSSRISRPDVDLLGSNGEFENFVGWSDVFDAQKSRALETPIKTPGNPGTPGNVGETLADTGTYHFPLADSKKIENGKSGKSLTAASSSKALDFGDAPRQRSVQADEVVVEAEPCKILPASDWWEGAAMAEVDALLAPNPPPAAPLPISAAQVRAGVEREVRDLAAHGRTGPGAMQDAIAITRAKIRNSPLLVEAQTGAGRCLVCEEAEVADRRFIPVLTGAPGRMHWIHLACHVEHSRRLAAKVDAIMSAAGFGEEQHRGAA